MLRVNEQFLIFDEDIDIDRQIKLFDELDATQGDIAYEFSLPLISENMAILGIPYADVSTKLIYKNVNCDVLDSDGIPKYVGLLRVDRLNHLDKKIECSFFSGNYNWFNLLTGPVGGEGSDLNFSEYDVDLTESNVINYSVNTSGIVFPLLDSGTLITRSYPSLKVEDFSPHIFVKDIFNKIFNTIGVKIKGDLMNDWVYNNMTLCKGLTNKTQIDARSSFVLKAADQTVFSGAADAKITFGDDSNFPYHDGSQDNYSTTNDRYTADVKMSVRIDISAVVGLNNSPDRMTLEVYKNGTTFRTWTITPVGSPADQTFTTSITMLLNATDYVELFISAVTFLGLNTVVRAATTVKFTPIFIYTVAGNSVVPVWTKLDFVSNILNIFNVITDYNPVSKEITFDLFGKISTKEPIDISEYLQVTDTDFSEFISTFSKKNVLKYQQSDNEEVREYNVNQFIKYGEGLIEIDNDFLQEKGTLLESEFKAPISYLNGALDASIERINVLEFEEGDTTNFTSVTDSVGEARFNGIANVISDLDIIRITESTDPIYNGDWMAYATGSGFLQCRGLSFNTNATGKITKLNYKYTDTDDVYLFINIPDYAVSDFSSLNFIRLESNEYPNFGYAYFNLLNTGRQVNDDYKQSLSFGDVENPLFYQRTIIDTYWRNVPLILSDPVKLTSIGHVPKSVFLSLTPLRPVYLKTEQTSNLYYINKISGYQKNYLPCTIELIKL